MAESKPNPLWKKVVAVVGASWLMVVGGVVGAAAAVAIVLHFVLSAIPPASSTKTELRPTPDVVLAIKSLSKLETESFHIEKVVDLADKEDHLFGLIQSKDAILLVAVGDVVAGVDLEGISAADVDTDWPNKSVKIRLPEARVFSATLDEKQTRVYARTTDLLTARHEDLEDRARVEAIKSMEKKALEEGILNRAHRDAERALNSLLRSVGFQNITFEWKK